MPFGSHTGHASKTRPRGRLLERQLAVLGADAEIAALLFYLGGVSSGFVTIRSNAKLQVLENGSLVLQHVDASDAGVYLCQATNGVGPELTHEAKLTVSGEAHKSIRCSNFVQRIPEGNQSPRVCRNAVNGFVV